MYQEARQPAQILSGIFRKARKGVFLFKLHVEALLHCGVVFGRVFVSFFCI